MIGLGLLWDVVDAAAYFCSQRRARLQRIHVRERCSARGPNGDRCVMDAGHREQHIGGLGWNAWTSLVFARCSAVDAFGNRCYLKDRHTTGHNARGVWNMRPVWWKDQGRCSVACMPSCSYPKCLS